MMQLLMVGAELHKNIVTSYQFYLKRNLIGENCMQTWQDYDSKHIRKKEAVRFPQWWAGKT